MRIPSEIRKYIVEEKSVDRGQLYSCKFVASAIDLAEFITTEGSDVDQVSCMNLQHTYVHVGLEEDVVEKEISSECVREVMGYIDRWGDVTISQTGESTYRVDQESSGLGHFSVSFLTEAFRVETVETINEKFSVEIDTSHISTHFYDDAQTAQDELISNVIGGLLDIGHEYNDKSEFTLFESYDKNSAIESSIADPIDVLESASEHTSREEEDGL